MQNYPLSDPPSGVTPVGGSLSYAGPVPQPTVVRTFEDLLAFLALPAPPAPRRVPSSNGSRPHRRRALDPLGSYPLNLLVADAKAAFRTDPGYLIGMLATAAYIAEKNSQE